MKPIGDHLVFRQNFKTNPTEHYLSTFDPEKSSPQNATRDPITIPNAAPQFLGRFTPKMREMSA